MKEFVKNHPTLSIAFLSFNLGAIVAFYLTYSIKSHMLYQAYENGRLTALVQEIKSF